MRKAILAAAVMFCSGLHAADIAEDTSVHTYDVYGSTVKEIADDLYQKSPLIEQGRHMQGFTEWKIQTLYNWQTDGHRCLLEKFDASLKVEMTLPNWVPPKHPAPQLVQQWERYIAALRKHEAGHAEVGEDAQQDLLARARSLGPVPSCEILTKQVNDLVAAVIDAHHKLEIDYDFRTNHGETQGAHFP
jgi:predicted secreted Zn-dependent protease